jgi:hypothetical protein
MMEDILAFVRVQQERRRDILEEACERMLTNPRGWGVLVVDEEVINFRDLKGELSYTAGLHPGVPFGHIFQFPSEAAVDRWQDRGCPR